MIIPFPNKKYNIIYADPAWTYDQHIKSGERGSCPYPTQSIEWHKALNVKEIADENCVLFMWVTMPKLNVCFDLIESWGFTYKTCGFTWIKKNKKSDSLFMGMGRWTRSNAELCLLATKGKPKRFNSGVHSVIYSAIEEHSKKPDIVKDRIVQLCGDLPRIELFARQKTNGWDCWGNEV